MPQTKRSKTVMPKEKRTKLIEKSIENYSCCVCDDPWNINTVED